MRALLYGLLYGSRSKLLFSAYLGVWFNVGVDVAVLAILSLPLVIAMRSLNRVYR